MIPYLGPLLLWVTLIGASNSPMYRPLVITLTVTTTVEHTQIVYAPGPSHTPVLPFRNSTQSQTTTVDRVTSTAQKPLKSEMALSSSVTSVPAQVTRETETKITLAWPHRTKEPVDTPISTATRARPVLNYENGGRLVIGLRPPLAATSAQLPPQEAIKGPSEPGMAPVPSPVLEKTWFAILPETRPVSVSLSVPQTGEKSTLLSLRTTHAPLLENNLVWSDLYEDFSGFETDTGSSVGSLAAKTTVLAPRLTSPSSHTPGPFEKNTAVKRTSVDRTSVHLSQTTVAPSTTAPQPPETAPALEMPTSSFPSSYSLLTAPRGAQMALFSASTSASPRRRLFPSNKTLRYSSNAAKGTVWVSFEQVLLAVVAGVLLCNFL